MMYTKHQVCQHDQTGETDDGSIHKVNTASKNGRFGRWTIPMHVCADLRKRNRRRLTQQKVNSFNVSSAVTMAGDGYDFSFDHGGA